MRSRRSVNSNVAITLNQNESIAIKEGLDLIGIS